jgi:hypothetical protein
MLVRPTPNLILRRPEGPSRRRAPVPALFLEASSFETPCSAGLLRMRVGGGERISGQAVRRGAAFGVVR